MGSPDPSGALTCHRAHLHALAIRITLNPFAPCFTKFLIFLFSSFSILCLKMSSSLQLHKKYSVYAILHSVSMRKKQTFSEDPDFFRPILAFLLKMFKQFQCTLKRTECTCKSLTFKHLKELFHWNCSTGTVFQAISLTFLLKKCKKAITW